jgi:hypothetical protein
MSTGLEAGWPDGYFNVFGSIRDDSFGRPPQGSWSEDVARGRF